MTDLIPVRRALISVFDKAGMAALGHALAQAGAEIVSTGGSAAGLRAAGVAVTEVEEFTGFPEILGGRVKTLTPRIHGGILGRRDNAADAAQMAAHGIKPIDLVAVNLYPFEAAAARGADTAEMIETIDIGGPAMTRSAAKNFRAVTVLTDPGQYDEVIEALLSGGTTLALRRKFAAAAFARSAAYDAAIAAWFAASAGDEFPERLALAGVRRQLLRYGENPHQQAAFYVDGGRNDSRPGIATAAQVQGKELSYNNLNDTDAAFECAAEFEGPAIVIVKHANPCGVAVADRLTDAWDRALAADPVSAFGGIVAMNRRLDAATAEKIAAIFTEVIIAPEADDAAKAVLAAKKNLRLLLAGGLPDAAAPGMIFRSVAGGFLAQSRDAGRIGPNDLSIVTKRPPTDQEMRDLMFAFRVGKHVKSNAIVYAKNGATTGIGAGQMSRVDSARIAAFKGGEAVRGSVVASDAFFPFADGLEAAISAGATAVIQPGGSIRDAEVIEAADAAGVAMVFTGMRAFRH